MTTLHLMYPAQNMQMEPRYMLTMDTVITLQTALRFLQEITL